ncbi:MAG: hypothetical protein LOY02_00835, partial [Intrasporangium sp.]|nr:hypothetical protein [Intrasporangium sp.]
MSDPSVVVQRAPDGWTHIGGPGMHLLIALEEEDDRTLTASDAADGGELDDVIDVLTAGGVRKAHHFVGVHWGPRTRIVAFGPVSVRLTLADGTEHEVRASNPRVWTDLLLDQHPERVELLVLDEKEREEPVPPSTLTAGPGGVAVVAALTTTTDARDRPATSPSPDSSEPPSPSPVASVTDRPEPVQEEPSPESELASASESASESESAPRSLPTFGTARPEESAAPASSWGRTWVRPGDETTGPEEPEPEAAAATPPTPAPTPSPSAGPAAPRVAPERAALRPWGPGPAVAPRRAAPGPTRETVSTAAATAPAAARAAPISAPEAADLPAAHTGPVDLESTWVARPAAPTAEDVPGSAAEPAPEPAPPAPRETTSAVEPTPQAEPGASTDSGAAPSYDYLFGHTVTVDEHRRILAGLDGTGDEADDDRGLDDKAPRDVGASTPAAGEVSGPATVGGRD